MESQKTPSKATQPKTSDRQKKTKYRTKSKRDVEDAKVRIEHLFSLADEIYSKHPELSDRYVVLARTLAMKYRTRMPSVLRRKYCHFCYGYLRPGVNCTVRTTGKTLTYTCKRCKKFSRMGYHQKKQKRISQNSQKV